MAAADEEALKERAAALEKDLERNKLEQDKEVRELQRGLDQLEALCRKLEGDVDPRWRTSAGSVTNSDVFSRRVEWVIEEFSKKEGGVDKSQSMWSPPFKAAGMEGLQLEFFPRGREKTSHAGFCSLFLWCHGGMKIKYQLFVGKFIRAPDEDEYNSRIGHGHSSFCPLGPEIDTAKDTVTVGVEFLEVVQALPVESRGLAIFPRPLEHMVASQAEILQNNNISRVVWKIPGISTKRRTMAQGTSIWSPMFTAAGIKDVLMEFYPNGSANTKKPGYCAFYLRCPEGSKMDVTLFVGKCEKGPISATFDSLTGKGLPEFCELEKEIDLGDDSVEIGITLQTRPVKTLCLES